LAVSINENRVTTALIDAIYPRDECGIVRGMVADADRVGLSSDTGVADIDVVISCGEIQPTINT
jgi:hypothetical protein